MSEYYAAGLPTPSPEVDPETRPYWDAAERGELVLPHCEPCGRPFWYPRGFCPRCGGDDLRWSASDGRGTVDTYSVVRRAGGAWASAVPFVLALVTLDAGVTVQANIVDCPAGDLAVGLRVAAVFERAEPEDLPVLRFVPVREPEAGAS
ncbi:Zn-ribbon domain-containing OB-fold protein [Actinomadura viridis]|uniref:OB-fold protein n=1 Tax=Actinomadura viridis TaxID=58110 RepID=A0A931DSE2_9ACTN|nr:OB-fold domain-containing protein [Actinomadura viridis]MBG6093087.1 putative OB-fold protein [Actinomadura viridis]